MKTRFSHERLRSQPRFETEANDNSEMTYEKIAKKDLPYV